MKGGSTLFNFTPLYSATLKTIILIMLWFVTSKYRQLWQLFFDIDNCFHMFNQIGPIGVELTQNNKFHYYIKITSQHHVEITMTLQLRHICSLDKINPVWRCPSKVCIVYPRNGEMKWCSTLFNNVERGFTLFNFMHFDGYILSSIQVGLSFDRVRYDRITFDNYPIIHLWTTAMTCDNQ